MPDFAAAVAALRRRRGLAVLAGVEAKILDRTGRLDLPERPAGIDLVLIADHQFPADHGPVHPADAGRLAGGQRSPPAEVDRLADRGDRERPGTARHRPQLAHLFSLLPKIGLDEADVPDPADRRRWRGRPAAPARGSR